MGSFFNNKNTLFQGFTLVGMQPEIGHMRMGFEDTDYAIAKCLRN